ncbi:MAG: hypothetical protein Q7U66_07810 [Methylobacter sp.]|nr:hypothetical protein [Methylobacter sp.]
MAKVPAVRFGLVGQQHRRQADAARRRQKAVVDRFGRDMGQQNQFLGMHEFSL